MLLERLGWMRGKGKRVEFQNTISYHLTPGPQQRFQADNMPLDI